MVLKDEDTNQSLMLSENINLKNITKENNKNLSGLYILVKLG